MKNPGPVLWQPCSWINMTWAQLTFIKVSQNISCNYASSAFTSSSLQCSLLFEACSVTASATASANVPSSSSEMPEVRNKPEMLMFSTHSISKTPVSPTDSPDQVPTTVHRWARKFPSGWYRTTTDGLVPQRRPKTERLRYPPAASAWKSHLSLFWDLDIWTTWAKAYRSPQPCHSRLDVK